MIGYIIEAWEKNKNILENYFRNNRQKEYDSYKKILEKIITLVINPFLKDNYDLNYPICEGLDEDFHIVDDGDYQGTVVYIMHFDCYQPNINEYIWTFVNYGSCTVCDTLLHISGYDTDLPTENQVDDYMMLALHLIQRMKRLNKEDTK